MKIILVRHALTHFNEIHLTQGWCDSPVSQKGKQQTEHMAKKLKDFMINQAYCSPIGRAKETLKILINNRDIPYQEDQRLKEIHFGIFEGTAIEIRDKMNIDSPTWFIDQKMDYRLYQGEWIGDVIARQEDFFKQLIADHYNQTILVVGHGCSIFAWLHFHFPDLYQHMQFINNSSGVVLTYENDCWNFLQYLDVEDLQCQ